MLKRFFHRLLCPHKWQRIWNPYSMYDEDTWRCIRCAKTKVYKWDNPPVSAL